MSDYPSTPASAGSRATEPPPEVAGYEVFPKPIGEGSYGQVFLARDVLGNWRAVKVIYRRRFDSDGPYEREWEGLRRFQRVSLSQPSQLPILQVHRDDAAGCFWYVMELADAVEVNCPKPEVQSENGSPAEKPAGIQDQASATVDPASYRARTLAHELRQRGRLSFEECLTISLALATALEHLHRHGLVHRDIKPGNIVFVNGIPKLADIGSVTGAGTRSFVGTEGYYPPEGPGTPAADIFGLGRVMYEMMTGEDRTAFARLPAGFAQWQDHPRWQSLNEVILKAGTANLTERYHAAAELHRDLVRVQAGESLRWQRRLERRWKVAKVVIGFVAVLALGGWGLATARAWKHAERREALIREAQTLRTGERYAGWFDAAWGKLQQAAPIRIDANLRAHAASTLAGLDARDISVTTNYGAEHLAFDPEGKRLLMDGGQTKGPARLWVMGESAPQMLPVKGNGPVWFDTAGEARLLISAAKGGFRLWNPESGEAVHDFWLDQAHGNLVANGQSLVVSEDASCFAAALTNAAGEGWVGVCEMRNGRWLAQTNRLATAVALSPDNRFLAVGEDDGWGTIFALPEFKELLRFQDDRLSVLCLAFGRGARHPLAFPIGATSGRPSLLQTNPGGNVAVDEPAWLLASGGVGGDVHVREIPTGRLKTRCRSSLFHVDALLFAPDGMTLIGSGHGLHGATAWNLATGGQCLWLHANDFSTALAMTRDGRYLATGSRVGFGKQVAVRVIELASSRGIQELRGLRSMPERVVFSEDGQWLAAVAIDWEVAVWNLASNRLEHLIAAPQGTSADNASLLFSRDGRRLAIAATSWACLWDLPTKQRLAHWELPQGLTPRLWQDDAGRLFHFQFDRFVGTNGGVCRVRELVVGQPLINVSEFFRLDRRIYDVSLAGQGAAVAVAGRDSSSPFHILKIFEPLTGKELRQIPSSVPESQDSDRLNLEATGQYLCCLTETNFTSAILNWRIGKSMAGRGLVAKVDAISPQGVWLAGAQPDGRGIRLAKMADLSQTLVVGIDAAISGNSCHFSPDGRRVTWATVDGTVFVCEIETTQKRLQAEGFGW